MKRQVKIFGRSVPLALIVLAVVATGVFAAWLWQTRLSLSATAGEGVSAEWLSSPVAVCSIEGAGSITECDVNNGRPILTMVGVKPGTVGHITAPVRNNGSAAIQMSPLVSPIVAFVFSSPQEGAPIDGGDTQLVTLNVDFTDLLTEGQVIDLTAVGALPIVFE